MIMEMHKRYCRIFCLKKTVGAGSLFLYKGRIIARIADFESDGIDMFLYGSNLRCLSAS